jgi:hypothetical protein
MSTYNIHVPEPSQIDYHADRQARRVERALKQIDVGDVLSIIDSRISSEPDPKAHPLYKMVAWHLEKCLTPLDGAEFFNTFKQLVMAAVDTCHPQKLIFPLTVLFLSPAYVCLGTYQESLQELFL